MVFGNKADANAGDCLLTSGNFPLSCAWHKGVEVEMNIPHSRINSFVLSLDMIFS